MRATYSCFNKSPARDWSWKGVRTAQLGDWELQGGPKPAYPTQRPVSEVERLAPPGAVPKVDDKAWAERVRCGGAGDWAEKKAEQRLRYATANGETIESFPWRPELCLRTPDLVVTCGHDQTIRTWDVRKGLKLRQTFEGHRAVVNVVESYRGDKLVSASDDMTLRVWRLGKEPEGELELTIWVSDIPITTVCPLPGQRAACAGSDKSLRIYSLATGHLLHKLWDHSDRGPDNSFMQSEHCGVVCSLLHLQRNILVSGADDSTVRVWDVDRGICFGWHVGHKGYGEEIGPEGRLHKLSREYAPVLRLVRLCDGPGRFASASYDRTVCIWDASDLAHVNVVRSWRAAENGITNMALLGPHHLATCAADKECRIWTLEGECVHRIETPRGCPTAAAALSDNLIAIGGGDATIRLYDWVNGQDLLGPEGFLAHEFIICWMCAVHFEDAAAENWTQTPILYQTVKDDEGKADAMAAVETCRRNYLQSLGTGWETY